MTPLTEALVELRLVVQRAEQRVNGAQQRGTLEDRRTESLADLMDAIDRIDPGWGTRLMLALYPHADAQGAPPAVTLFNRDRKSELSFRDCLEPAMSITDESDARQYLAAYVAHIQAFLDREPRRDGMDALQIAKVNLGYFAGYYSHETRLRVERLFGCVHPYLGRASDGQPTPQQAFAAGVAHGNRRGL